MRISTDLQKDNDIFQDHTHPKDLDFTHLSSWETFLGDLNKIGQSIFPQHPIEYEGVHALLINWFADDLGTDTEVSDMDALFRDHFNYSSETWKIPTRHSEDALERKLSEVKAQFGGENRLLIIYYGGHGRLDPMSRSIWQAYVPILYFCKDDIELVCCDHHVTGFKKIGRDWAIIQAALK